MESFYVQILWAIVWSVKPAATPDIVEYLDVGPCWVGLLAQRENLPYQNTESPKRKDSDLFI